MFSSQLCVAPLPFRDAYSSSCNISLPEHCTRWSPGSTKGITCFFFSRENVRICSSATLVGGGVEGGSEDVLGIRACEIFVGATYAESFSENSNPRSSNALPTVCRSLLGTRMKSV